jgi:hypothetical protein
MVEGTTIAFIRDNSGNPIELYQQPDLFKNIEEVLNK